MGLNEFFWVCTCFYEALHGITGFHYDLLGFALDLSMFL